jgi:hypothetical protein
LFSFLLARSVPTRPTLYFSAPSPSPFRSVKFSLVSLASPVFAPKRRNFPILPTAKRKKIDKKEKTALIWEFFLEKRGGLNYNGKVVVLRSSRYFAAVPTFSQRPTVRESPVERAAKKIQTRGETVPCPTRMKKILTISLRKPTIPTETTTFFRR